MIILEQIIEKLLIPIIFRVVMEIAQRWKVDPEFYAKAFELKFKVDSAKTRQEKLDATKAIHDLLRS